MTTTEIALTEEQEYLALLMQPVEGGTALDNDINLNKLTKRIVLTSDSPEILVKLDKEQVTSAKTLYILIEAGLANRALFQPKNFKPESKSPVCATGLFPLDAEEVKGVCTITQGLEQPYLVDGMELRVGDVRAYDCKNCQFNRYDSEPMWDETKTGKGKACKESRAYFVRIVNKQRGVEPIIAPNKEELYRFVADPEYDDPVRMILTLGANRANLDKMIVSARARKIPLTSCVWKIGVNIVEPGPGIKYAQMVFEFAGVPSRDLITQARSTDKAWIDEFVARNAKHGVEDVEMPFG
jgi:hypothetical protein